LDRHKPPLTRRFVVYYCSAVYISNEIMFAVSDSQSRFPWSEHQDLGFDIEITETLIGLLGAGDDADQAIRNAIVSGLIENIEHHFAISEAPFEFDVDRYAHVRIALDAKCSISGPPISPEAELRRILQKHFRKPPEQLSPSDPGIMVIKSASVLDPGMVRKFLEPLLAARGDSGFQLSVAVFLPARGSVPIEWALFPPFAVLNPCARVHPSEVIAYRTLATAFGVVE
jgi:hypothetical protein